MDKYIRVWQNYGENPCEGLEELGFYQEFLTRLSQYEYDISFNNESNCLYRGLSCQNDYSENQILEFINPTSWSESKSVASEFAKDGVLLILRLFEKISGYRVPPNEYKEKEVILAPLKLKIMRISGNEIYLYIFS